MCGFDKILQKVCIDWRKKTDMVSHVIRGLSQTSGPIVLFLVWKPAMVKIQRFCQYCDCGSEGTSEYWSRCGADV